MYAWILLFLCAPASVLSHVSSGGGGVQCGGVKCLKFKAKCVNSTCDCQAPFVLGDGDFDCHRRNKIVATVKGDPMINTFDGRKYQMHLPCRYQMTHFESVLKVNKQKKGYCECQVHQWNKKNKGKMYPAGYDVACRVNYTDGTAPWTMGASIIKEGYAEYAIYNFTEWGRDHYATEGAYTTTPGRIDQDGVVMETVYDDDNNFGLTQFRACGLDVGLRPLDVTLGVNQDMPNGVWITVNCAHQVVFKSNDRNMATAPAINQGVPFVDSITPGLTPPQSFLFRALLSDVEQNQPHASPECEELSTVAEFCDTIEKKQLAMIRCEWILKRPTFVRCVDESDNANTILYLMRRCFQAACTSQVTCDEFTDEIFDTGCAQVRSAPELDEYMTGAMCRRGV